MCLAFGGENIHPDYLLERLTPQQFHDWETYFALEPQGEERADLRMARMVWATLQAANTRKLDERKYLFDFRPQDSSTLSHEEYKRRAMAAWTGAGGGIKFA